MASENPEVRTGDLKHLQAACARLDERRNRWPTCSWDKATVSTAAQAGFGAVAASRQSTAKLKVPKNGGALPRRRYDADSFENSTFTQPRPRSGLEAAEPLIAAKCGRGRIAQLFGGTIRFGRMVSMHLRIRQSSPTEMRSTKAGQSGPRPHFAAMSGSAASKS